MTPVANKKPSSFDQDIGEVTSGFSAGSAAMPGLVYFLSVFAIGFGLGTLRVLVLAPLAGDLSAVLIELPIILGLAWWICGKLVRKYKVAPRITLRLLMGGVALALLLIAEFALSTLVMGNSVMEHLQSYLSAPHAIGLAGQCAFALFPAIQYGYISK